MNTGCLTQLDPSIQFAIVMGVISVICIVVATLMAKYLG